MKTSIAVKFGTSGLSLGLCLVLSGCAGSAADALFGQTGKPSPSNNQPSTPPSNAPQPGKAQPAASQSSSQATITPPASTNSVGAAPQEVTVVSPQENSGMIDAAKTGDLEKVKALLKDNPGMVNSRDTNNDTALHWAAFNGHKDVAEWLLATQADLNARDNDGETPLHRAASGGHADVVELLLARGTEVNARMNLGRTPMRLAEFWGHNDVAELLRQHGGAH
jgi:hypothetical protein